MLKAVYAVFLVNLVIATAIGLLLIWGVVLPGETLWRVWQTATALAAASALALSATRMATNRRPLDLD